MKKKRGSRKEGALLMGDRARTKRGNQATLILLVPFLRASTNSLLVSVSKAELLSYQKVKENGVEKMGRGLGPGQPSWHRIPSMAQHRRTHSTMGGSGTRVIA